MANFKDLSPRSISILEPHIKYWSLGDSINGDLPIDHKFGIETTGFNRYIAEYAITYAALLGDKELTEDLCQHGVNLDVKDSWNANKTPLEVAIEYGRAGVVAILIKHGAKLTHNVEVPSNNPYSNPYRFFWSVKENAFNREVDYGAVDSLLHHNKLNNHQLKLVG